MYYVWVESAKVQSKQDMTFPFVHLPRASKHLVWANIFHLWWWLLIVSPGGMAADVSALHVGDQCTKQTQFNSIIKYKENNIHVMSCAPVKKKFNYTVSYSTECFTMR